MQQVGKGKAEPGLGLGPGEAARRVAVAQLQASLQAESAARRCAEAIRESCMEQLSLKVEEVKSLGAMATAAEEREVCCLRKGPIVVKQLTISLRFLPYLGIGPRSGSCQLTL